MRKHNFGAGPGILPESVIRKTQEALYDFNGIGMGIMEISHRSKDFEGVLNRTKALVRELLSVPDTHDILFLQGGATQQFAMIPMNFLKTRAAYLDQGAWSAKAIKEARNIGEVLVLASSRDKNYSYQPRNYIIPEDADYLHICSNETIHGTQVHTFPESPIPLICDMSSDIFSRRIDVSKFDLIYAGAQKNMGPAGVTLVIIKKDRAGTHGKKLPAFFDYKTHLDNNSLYNTPPVTAILVCMYMLEWLREQGGVEGIEKINQEKAALIYRELDTNPMFCGTAASEDRSLMNACFLLNDSSLEEEFLKATQQVNITGIKGHRSVGGFRASMYNALPLESVKVLVETMREFSRVNA